MIRVLEQFEDVFENAYTALRWSGYRGDLPDGSVYQRIKALIQREFDNYIDPERRKLTAVLINDLKGLSDRELVKKMQEPEFREKVEYLKLQQGLDACKNTSLLFNPHRLSVKTKKSESIIDAIKSEKYLSGLARAMLFDGSYSVQRGFAIGANGVQLAYEFPPLSAREYCIAYAVPEDGRVLDPCAGWGGRMLGVSTVCRNYVGYEPATQTYNGLRELEKFIRLLNPKFNAVVYKECFEDSKIEPESFDFAITSPPYYDTELYSDEPTNSCNRYKSFDEWCEKFNLPMIDKTMNALKPGKTFVLVIGSRTYPLRRILEEHCKDKYEFEDLKDRTLQPNSAVRGDSEGESFYVIRKPL